MMPTRKTQLLRITACRSDLAHNGIDTDALGPRALRDLARRNLEYFQSMLGYDAGLREVLGLIGRARGPSTVRASERGGRAGQGG